MVARARFPKPIRKKQLFVRNKKPAPGQFKKAAKPGDTFITGGREGDCNDVPVCLFFKLFLDFAYGLCESASVMKGDQESMIGMMLDFNWMIQAKLSVQITKSMLTVNRA